MLADAHIHLDWGKNTFDALDKARKLGVKEFLAMGMDSMNNHRAILFAKDNKDVRPCAGLYFETVYRLSEDVIDAEIENIEKDKDKIFGIGEVGLDKHWHKNEGFEEQKFLLQRMMDLALKLKKPLIVHSREAEEDVLGMLRNYKGKVLLHCFMGSKAQARDGIEKGFYFSVNPVIFKHPEMDEVIKLIPLHSLLTESDFPYSGFGPDVIPKLIEKIAEVKGLKKEEVEKAVWENYKKFLKA